MCLILIAYQQHPDYKLVIATNRDEFYTRRTQPAHWWEDHEEVLGGRDLQAGGTWMGITKGGRIAALTNYREPGNIRKDAPSRGDLVKDFLTGDNSPKDYLSSFDPSAFNGYNLLVGSTEELWYTSNRGVEPTQIQPGVYGLSNHVLDTPWPKVRKGKAYMTELIQTQPLEIERALTFLGDASRAPDSELPQTGVSLEWEQLLSPMFIESPTYGTRVSTVILVDQHDQVHFQERGYIPAGDQIFNFQIH